MSASSRDERHEGADDRHEPAQDDGLAAVSLEERVRPSKMVAVEAAVRTSPIHRRR